VRVLAARTVGWLLSTQLIPASLCMCRCGPPHAGRQSVYEYEIPPVCLYICVSSICREHDRLSCHANTSGCRAGPLYRLRACHGSVAYLVPLAPRPCVLWACRAALRRPTACGALLRCIGVHASCRNAWSATSTRHHYLCAPPRARTGRFFCCHLNYDLLLYEAITVILLCNFLK